MTAAQLYQLWTDAHAAQDCSVETWDQVEADVRAVFEYMAPRLVQGQALGNTRFMTNAEIVADMHVAPVQISQLKQE